MSITVTIDTVDYVFDFADQRIDVPAAVTVLNIYTLWRAIRTAQGTEVGIAYPPIASASGLDELDPVEGVSTFITVKLFDSWEINSLLTGGNFRTKGGNILRADGNDPFRDNPLLTYMAFFSQAGVTTQVVTGSGVTDQDKTDIITGTKNAILGAGSYP